MKEELESHFLIDTAGEEKQCEKCKELTEKWGDEHYEAICWDCHDKRVDEYEKRKER